ncbi:MAG: GNAT family N-acetyltransferase [Nitrososphaerales archaeon]
MKKSGQKKQESGKNTESVATRQNGPAGIESNVSIREIKESELEHAASLIARLKRLNGEFDPLLKTSASLEADALKTLRSDLENRASVVLVAIERSNKVVGVVKAELVDRVFYEPRKEGAIDEFYILPEFRRGRLGNDLLNAMVENLQKKGAVLITAEFPSQNDIAKRFYTKLGFRSLTNVYARSY